jgi:hypothetical protein
MLRLLIPIIILLCVSCDFKKKGSLPCEADCDSIVTITPVQNVLAVQF